MFSAYVTAFVFRINHRFTADESFIFCPIYPISLSDLSQQLLQFSYTIGIKKYTYSRFTLEEKISGRKIFRFKRFLEDDREMGVNSVKKDLFTIKRGIDDRYTII